MTKFVAFLKEEAGASAAEYALILAIVGAGIALAAIALGGAVGTSVNDAANCITNTSTC
jgi:pilus assembly protein Flp/PilA